MELKNVTRCGKKESVKHDEQENEMNKKGVQCSAIGNKGIGADKHMLKHAGKRMSSRQQTQTEATHNSKKACKDVQS
jgi:hypothetical protein